jgi:hypothetical protein
MTPEISIILTSTVHVQNKECLFQKDSQWRLANYLKSVRQWLSTTSCNIILVENMGYTYPELQEECERYKDRFEIISFVEDSLAEAQYLRGHVCKGASELFAIHYAIHHSKILRNSIFIIKVTARYFVPELEKFLYMKNVHTYDAVTQNNIRQCEIVGSHIRNVNTVFHPICLDENGNYMNVEYIYCTRIAKLPNVLQCKIFPIEPTQRGGVPYLYTEL